ncbi:MAG: MBL fold metallo-hydrolase [Christensenellaceae bacterium]|jgi:L-ascorbate metabolism protein UlaG (beta-lactamase superfamily)|nr:MBL fold metallo-hydrolase [Christensenellaceae bacterium]
MEIEWLGHSSFRLVESTGLSIVTDPYDGKKVGIPFPDVSSDVVTISHKHFDHDAIQNVKDAKLVIETPGPHELHGVRLNGFLSYHDQEKGKKRGRNIVYKIRMDGVELCHLGDIGEELSPMLAEFIGMVNVLLIPVGGIYTIDANQAKEYVDMLMPDVVIPMHYMQDGYKTSLNSLDEFTDLFDKDDVEYVDGNTMEFDRNDFSGDRTKVIVFNLKH